MAGRVMVPERGEALGGVNKRVDGKVTMPWRGCVGVHDELTIERKPFTHTNK